MGLAAASVGADYYCLRGTQAAAAAAACAQDTLLDCPSEAAKIAACQRQAELQVAREEETYQQVG